MFYKNKNIFYQGESISMKFSKENLGDNDFIISIYPHYYIDDDNAITFTKENMDKLDDNTYIFTIPYTDTKLLPIGYYDFEIVIKSLTDDNRQVERKKNIFYLDYSNLKNT